MCSLSIVDLHVAVNNRKVLGVTTEMQKWVPFALQTSYKSFRTADNNTNLNLHVKSPTLLSDFNGISRSLTDLRKSPPLSNFKQTHPVSSAMITCGQTEGHDRS